jgi:hypothetical protein
LIKPIIGVANSGDYERLMRPLGIAFIIDRETEVSFRRNYLITNYEYVERRDVGFQSPAEIAGNLAIAVSNSLNNDGFSLKYMGLVNVAFYLGAISLLFIGLVFFDVKYSLYLLLLGIFIFTNKEIIHYFNTFYYESASIYFFIMFVGFSTIYFGNKASIKKYLPLFFPLQILTAFLFINSKIQNIPFLFPFSLLFLYQISYFLKTLKYTKTLRILSSFVIISVFLISPTFYYFKSGVERTDNVTSYNIIMNEILGESNNPQVHLKRIGFKEKDIPNAMEYVGMNLWGKDRDLYESNIEIFNRKTEIDILVHEPMLVLKLTKNKSQSLFEPLPYGNFVKGEDNSEKIISNTISNFLNKIKSFYPQNAFFFFGIIGSLICILVYRIIKRLPEISPNIDMFILAMAIGVILEFFTVVFADSCESVKHLFLVNVSFDILFLSLIYYIVVSIISIKKLGMSKKDE